MAGLQHPGKEGDDAWARSSAGQGGSGVRRCSHGAAVFKLLAVDDTETYSEGDAELAITVAGAVVSVVATSVSVDAVVLAA